MLLRFCCFSVALHTVVKFNRHNFIFLYGKYLIYSHIEAVACQASLSMEFSGQEY